jgi:hypothetical protein
MLDLHPGDSIEIVNINYIDKTIMGWKNGDILQIKDVEPEFNRILVYDSAKTKAEYIYDYEFAGIRPAKINQELFV